MNAENTAEASFLHRSVLYFDPQTRQVLRGPWKGQDVRFAQMQEVTRLLKIGNPVRCHHTTHRPWWRLWQRTPVIILTPEAAP